MAGRPKARAKREAAARKKEPPGSARTDPTVSELEQKVQRADVESQIRSIAGAAVAEQDKIRGPSRFKARHDIPIDALPEASAGSVPPPAGLDRKTASKSMEVLGRNLELAFQLTTDWMVDLTGTKHPPAKEQVSDCAEAWGLALEAYGERVMATHPELAVAASVTLLAYLPMGVELYFRARRGPGAPAEVATADEVAQEEVAS